MFTVEVKDGRPTPSDIYQAKMYKEIYGATFGFLIVTMRWTRSSRQRSGIVR